MKRSFSIGFAVWTFIVLIASLIPGSNFHGANWLSLFQLDKVVHLCFYFVMCMLMYLSIVREDLLKQVGKHALLTSVCFSIGLGVLTEILQSNLNAGRYFDIFDILANTIGVVLAALIVLIKQIK